MPSGKLKKFFDDKGFGFIIPDDGSEDLFAHKLKFNGDENDIREGSRVDYEAGLDDRSGKMRATSWSIQGGGESKGGGSRGGMIGAPSGGKTGIVKKFFQDKAFGFITMDDGSGDVFAPARTFTGDERDIREGLKVTLETGMDDRSSKLRATSWSPMGGSMMPPQGGYGPMHGADPRFSPYGAIPHPQPGYGAYPGYGAPAPQYGMPSLPPGWEQVTDPASGRPYFCNRATGETSWTPPGAPASAPASVPAASPSAGGLPQGWEQVTDPASGKPYFCNRSTGETSWTPPAMPAAAPAPVPVPAAAPAQGGLPHGWESASDPGSGKTYFFNRTTNETRWDPPRA